MMCKRISKRLWQRIRCLIHEPQVATFVTAIAALMTAITTLVLAFLTFQQIVLVKESLTLEQERFARDNRPHFNIRLTQDPAGARFYLEIENFADQPAVDFVAELRLSESGTMVEDGIPRMVHLPHFERGTTKLWDVQAYARDLGLLAAPRNGAIFVRTRFRIQESAHVYERPWRRIHTTDVQQIDPTGFRIIR